MSRGPARDRIKARYDALLARERRQARALALAVFPTGRLSVWEVLLLPLLVVNHMRQKQVRDLFVENHLFTKRLALEGALDVARGDRTREAVDERIRARTAEILESTPDDLYSEEIRAAQLAEIDLVLGHALRLLAVDGSDYDALVRDAYPDREAYETHLEELHGREQAVATAAVRTLRAKGDPGVAEAMRETSLEVRAREVDRIYAPHTDRKGR